MKEYYLSDGENKRGAFSLKDLKHETVLPDTLIWKEGWEEWKTAKDAALVEPAIDLIIDDSLPLNTRQDEKPKKKKKSLLKTIIKASDGDLGDLIQGQVEKKTQAESEGAAVAVRKNPLTAVFDILFRREFSETYFNKRVLGGVIFTLVSLKLFLSIKAYKEWIFDSSIGGIFMELDSSVLKPYPFCVMDIFIPLVLVLGLYHLSVQKVSKRQGEVTDIQARGISHFGFLGKHIMPDNPQFGAMLFVEPLIAFVLSFLLLYNDSLIFGIIAILAAGQFWYENYLIYQKHQSNDSEINQNGTVMPPLVKTASSGLGFTSTLGGAEQAKTQGDSKENPSFTTMIYYAIGERLDNYLAANPDKVNSTPLLTKIQEWRGYFKGLNINQRKSVNFFISSAIVFLTTFLVMFLGGNWSEMFVEPFYMVTFWSAFLAFSQLKILDNLLNKLMRSVYTLDLGLIPLPIKNMITGIVKFIVYIILFIKLPYIGIVYMIYRIVIPFLDFENLPSFEKA